MDLWSSLKPPKPKQHGAWGMLYVPFLVSVGITRTFDLKMVLLLFAITLVFLSQQPLAFILTQRSLSFSSSTLRLSLAWLGAYWILSAILFVILYSQYQLFDLCWFALAGLLVAASFVYFITRNRVRSVPGELVGIWGLTMTAPLAHYTAVGQIQFTGIALWCVHVMYFASSVFYIKARVQHFLKSKSNRASVDSSIAHTCTFYHVTLLLLLTGLVISGVTSVLSILAFLPIIIRGLWGMRKPSVKLNLKRIGLLEVAYSLFFALVLIWEIRAGILSQSLFSLRRSS